MKEIAYQLVEGDLWPFGIEHEPPSVAGYCRHTDVDTNDHVAEEEPLRDERLATAAWWHAHDRMIRRIEAESSCRQAISDKVNPEQLYGYQGLWHAKQNGEEDADYFTDV